MNIFVLVGKIIFRKLFQILLSNVDGLFVKIICRFIGTLLLQLSKKYFLVSCQNYVLAYIVLDLSSNGFHHTFSLVPIYRLF